MHWFCGQIAKHTADPFILV